MTRTSFRAVPAASPGRAAGRKSKPAPPPGTFLKPMPRNNLTPRTPARPASRAFVDSRNLAPEGARFRQDVPGIRWQGVSFPAGATRRFRRATDSSRLGGGGSGELRRDVAGDQIDGEQVGQSAEPPVAVEPVEVGVGHALAQLAHALVGHAALPDERGVALEDGL